MYIYLCVHLWYIKRSGIALSNVGVFLNLLSHTAKLISEIYFLTISARILTGAGKQIIWIIVSDEYHHVALPWHGKQPSTFSDLWRWHGKLCPQNQKPWVLVGALSALPTLNWCCEDQMKWYKWTFSINVIEHCKRKKRLIQQQYSSRDIQKEEPFISTINERRKRISLERALRNGTPRC